MTRYCAECGKAFEGSEKACYCPTCREKVKKQHAIESKRKAMNEPCITPREMAEIVLARMGAKNTVTLGRGLALAIAEELNKR